MKYESVFISDTHLGMRNIDSKKLLSFLLDTQCNKLYLVGDIVDTWAMKNRLYWPQINSDIINAIYQKFLDGTKIYYLPGNHDDVFKKLKILVDDSKYFFRIDETVIHDGLNGKTYIVTHGDIYDTVVMKIKWLAYLGSFLYDVVFWLNVKLHNIFGSKWSLSQWSKKRVKQVVSFLDSYEDGISKIMIEEKVDGIICGHIHHPRIKKINGIEYMNCGDFVESFSAIVEKEDGIFELKFFK